MLLAKYNSAVVVTSPFPTIVTMAMCYDCPGVPALRSHSYSGPSRTMA